MAHHTTLWHTMARPYPMLQQNLISKTPQVELHVYKFDTPQIQKICWHHGCTQLCWHHLETHLHLNFRTSPWRCPWQPSLEQSWVTFTSAVSMFTSAASRASGCPSGMFQGAHPKWGHNSVTVPCCAHWTLANEEFQPFNSWHRGAREVICH